MKRVVISLLVLLVISCTSSLAQNRSDFPVVVARVKLTGQTAAIPLTTIFTPKSSGMFRMSIVAGETVKANIGSWNGFVAWRGITTNSTSFKIQTDRVRETLNSFPFSAAAGGPVTLHTVAQGDTSGSKYDVFIVIERLTKIPNF